MVIIQYKNGDGEKFINVDEYRYDGKAITLIKDGKVFFIANMDVVATAYFSNDFEEE